MLPKSLSPTVKLMYGTAWKGEQTAVLVEKAVLCGFRGIDTACQPKHYREDLVGEAIQLLQHRHGILRSALFVQPKFTPITGQDERVPYDPKAPIEEQVLQSFEKSKKNLRTDYVDSLIMHSPFSSYANTLTAWRALESIHRAGGARHIGVSNLYDLQLFRRLYEDSEVKPSILQNRFYAETGYDVELRAFCQLKGIQYQSFWTLTANPHILRHPDVVRLSLSTGRTPVQLLFRYLIEAGVQPLTGTKSEAHMREDLEVLTFELDRRALDIIENSILSFASL
jgi:diketogulonate reductase-like aldo/keto reductase